MLSCARYKRPYSPPGVIGGLHVRKQGMHRSQFLASGLTLVIGVAVILLISSFVGGDDILGTSTKQSDYSGFANAPHGTPGHETYPEIRLGENRDHELCGVYRNVRIISTYEAPVVSSVHDRERSSEFLKADVVAGGDLEQPGLTGPVGDIPDYDLPTSPMWQHTVRAMSGFGLPSDKGHEIIDTRDKSRPPHAILASPQWPIQEQPSFYDSSVVDGFLVLHSTGRVTFELIRESHPNRGFAEEVERAMASSRCYPALDAAGQTVTVRCRYRCVFTDSDEPSVRVSSESESDKAYDGSITATVIR